MTSMTPKQIQSRTPKTGGTIPSSAGNDICQHCGTHDSMNPCEDCKKNPKTRGGSNG